jgi:HK97 family phage prohead protease/HK97 family phage major capsid protein
MRYAVKSAPPPSGEPLQFVMSDGSVDRMGDVIEPTGWQLKHFKAHPIALLNHDRDQIIGKWADVRIDGGRLLGRLELAAEGTSALVDTVRKLVEQDILRAVSVGFKPIEQKPLTDEADKYFGPFRFMKSELLECSLVAVPANANALSTAKSLGLPGEHLAEVFRKPAEPTPRAPARSCDATHAKPGKPPLARLCDAKPTGTPIMSTLSQRIEDLRKHVVNLRDKLTELANKEQLDDVETVEFEELPDEIDRQEAALSRLEKAEKKMTQPKSAADKPRDGEILPPVSAPRIGTSFPQVKLQPYDHLVRSMVVFGRAKVLQQPIEQVLRECYRDDEVTGTIIRTAMAPAMTTVAGWAQELVGTAIADLLQQLQLVSIYPRLSGYGSKFTFGRNGIIKIPARSATPKINGSFVGEGQPIPVRKLGLSSITLTPKKMAVISEFTREMAMASTPSIESVIRQAINEDTAEAIDQALIDATVADTIRPAGLRAGVSGLTPSAATTAFDKMIADIKALIAPIVAARGGRKLVLLMNTAQSLSMSWVVAPNGEFIFADVASGTLRNLTVITSTTVPAGMLIMLDAADFASVTGDTAQFDVSDVATLHEEDTAPLPIVGGTVQPPVIGSIAAPVRSLFQTASIAVRLLLDMNWTMRRTGMVSWMTGVTW